MVLRIGLILPDIMGTYGDRGNALILAKRARLHGIAAEIITITIHDPVPHSLDIYTIGGAEDCAQKLAVKHFQRYPGLQKAAQKGAQILAICAGLQILGNWWENSDGQRHEGLGLLDIMTQPMAYRAIGEIITTPSEHARSKNLTQQLSGFENHRGGTSLGPDAYPLAYTEYGIGNGYCDEDKNNSDYSKTRMEGTVHNSIYATYLHGPLLARNPDFADLLIAKATGIALTPLELPFQKQLREECIAAAKLRYSDPSNAVKSLA